ncbi:MAG: metal-dependent transcriptional regulator [Candidatus Hydrogenedens sp.]|nr:metal-dependent transcriptional regulator [Candidatus Hydrogenedens sp.]
MKEKSQAKEEFKARDMSAEGASWREYTYSNLSHSRAHYLLAIESLRGELGYARTTDIAEMLEVSRGAASMALAQLKKRGWVTEDPNRFLLLTAEGKQMTELVSRNFEVLRFFFESVLGISADLANEEACKMEHLITVETSNRLNLFNKTLSSDPELLQKILRETDAAQDS